MAKEMSATKQKILLLLLAGVAFGLTYTPQRQWRIIKEFSNEWKWIDKKKLHNAISQLYQSKLLKKNENSDGSTTLTLTHKGKLKTLTFHFQKMILEKKDWDGKWRMVIFDIPEKIRNGRDALREKLQKLGFYELQKSVFVFPYECEDEIEFIIEFFNLKRFVRFGVLNSIDNALHLKQHFRLI